MKIYKFKNIIKLYNRLCDKYTSSFFLFLPNGLRIYLFIYTLSCIQIEVTLKLCSSNTYFPVNKYACVYV
jgi:hypothetical protein